MAGNNPTQVNIGIGLDMDALKKSVGLARGEVETFVRDIKKQQTDLATFNKKAAAADTLFTQGSISAQEHATAIAGLAKQYNQIGERGEAMFGGIAARLKFNEEALARTVDKQKQGLAMLELQDKVLHNMGVEEEKIVQAHIRYAKELGVTSPLMQKMADDAKRLALAEQESAAFIENIVKTRIAMEQEKHAKITADIAAEKLAEENSMIFLMELRKQQRIDEEQRHAKKLADLAAEKLAEENSMIFLMELRKQQRIDEEQRHAKRLAEIAAEKQAQATLGLNAYGTATPTGRASSALIDAVTGKVIEQKKEISSLEQLIGTIPKSSSPTGRASSVLIDAVTGKVIKQAEQVHSQAIRKRQDEQRQADRDRFRSLLDQAKTHKQIVAESDRFIERMKQQYNLSDKLVKKLKELERLRIDGGTGISGLLNKVSAASGGMLPAIGSALAVSKATQFAADSVKLGMERQRIDMMIGALNDGNDSVVSMTTAIRELDRQSGLTYGEIAKAAQTMLGFGVSTQLVMPSLNALSQISMGNAERFQSLSLAFGQVAASGKLAGQEILQMVNAGFNPLQEISRVTGRSMEDLRKATSDGEISFRQVAEAIIKSTEAGGRFSGINKIILETLSGQIAKFKSEMEVMRSGFGQDLFPFISSMVETISSNKDSIQFLFDTVVSLGDFIAIFISGLNDVLTNFMPTSGRNFINDAMDEPFIRRLKDQREKAIREKDDAKVAELDKKLTAMENLTKQQNTSKTRMAIDDVMEKIRVRNAERKAREEEIKNSSKAKEELLLNEEERKKLLNMSPEEKQLLAYKKAAAEAEKQILEKRNKLLNDEKERLADELGLKTNLLDQQQRLNAERILGMDQENKRIEQQQKDREAFQKILEDSKSATEKIQDDIAFINKLLNEGVINQKEAQDGINAINQKGMKKKQEEQDKLKKEWQDFARSIDPQQEAIRKVRDIMLAVEYGFLDAIAAKKLQLEAVKDLAKDETLNMDNPRMMDFGQAVLENQKARKMDANQEIMKNKLIDIAKLSQQQVDLLKQQGGFAERN